MNKFFLITLIIFPLFLVVSCQSGKKEEKQTPSTSPTTTEEPQSTDAMQDKGVGPIKHVDLAPLNEEMASEGKNLFAQKCTACHKIGEKYIGPDLTGVTQRRSPEWIMNMILNPEVMIKEDPIAKNLFNEFSAPMTNQKLTEEEARKILEYFRSLD
ncbi:c-type cytochrome [Xanthovirga aplysinae]|uniref:c-type cytochrome n=1 Tax=Xanthovirga aplysinae TaxID=2529853 RepID=UPI0012BB5D7D|nr:cytochrome c [Xanthovirga aplysinae]MTI33490.1 cytochrome c [Xanthovirga aplysinae]